MTKSVAIIFIFKLTKPIAAFCFVQIFITVHQVTKMAGSHTQKILILHIKSSEVLLNIIFVCHKQNTIFY